MRYHSCAGRTALRSRISPTTAIFGVLHFPASWKASCDCLRLNVPPFEPRVRTDRQFRVLTVSARSEFRPRLNCIAPEAARPWRRCGRSQQSQSEVERPCCEVFANQFHRPRLYQLFRLDVSGKRLHRSKAPAERRSAPLEELGPTEYHGDIVSGRAPLVRNRPYNEKSPT